MMGWADCPRCGGTGRSEGVRNCGFHPLDQIVVKTRSIAVSAYPKELMSARTETPPALPRCPYGSDDSDENHRILRELYWDTAWEKPPAMTTSIGGAVMLSAGGSGDVERGVRAVLVSGSIGDYAVYLGAGSAEWVRANGAKLGYEQAKGLFPGICRERYRE